ncbi:transposase [Pandoraea horticolens]|uniref:Mutator family transposase n=1 Tax=Pandoraea horticolens TaxID=2508298 RepID=A0A5E4XRP1_9BURK|nr:transposase [Pandoraea horticolens]
MRCGGLGGPVRNFVFEAYDAPNKENVCHPKARLSELPAIPSELLEQFGDGPMTAEAINAAAMALKKALIERALGGEMNHHLGYLPGAAKPTNATNQRNGKGAKTVLTEDGPIRIEVPRDRDGSFEPILIPKHERRFDDKIVAMYARGMTVREILGFLLEQCGTVITWVRHIEVRGLP